MKCHIWYFVHDISSVQRKKGVNGRFSHFHFFYTFKYLDLILIIWQNSKNIGKTDFLKNAFEEMMKSYSDRKFPRKKVLSPYGTLWHWKIESALKEKSLGKRPHHLMGLFYIERLSLQWQKYPLEKGPITLWGLFALEDWVCTYRKLLRKKALWIDRAFSHCKIKCMEVENPHRRRPYRQMGLFSTARLSVW